jgi:hypothetical protein
VVVQQALFGSGADEFIGAVNSDTACFVDTRWHSDVMAGKDIDPIRAKSALAVIRQHPVLVLFAVSPALAVLGVIWWLAGAGWAIAATIVSLLVAAGLVVVRR